MSALSSQLATLLRQAGASPASAHPPVVPAKAGTQRLVDPVETPTSLGSRPRGNDDLSHPAPTPTSVVPAKAGTQHRVDPVETPTPLGSRLRGNDDLSHPTPTPTSVVPAKAGTQRLVDPVETPRSLDFRLRGRGGAYAVATPRVHPRPPVPEHLRRLLRLREGAQAARRPRADPRDRDVAGEEIAPGLRYVEKHLPCPDLPGLIDAGFSGHGLIAPGRCLHFDTETTGLAGGTGTRAFMIGAANWLDGHLRVRQLTLTAMRAEAAMLDAFAHWVREDTVLVSYNGKSYDAPLLATRFRLMRMPNPLPACLHLDLLHPVRRRWRGHWPNCRLATAERQLLDVVREDDLPGAEAPRAWREFLQGGSARDLRRVGEHNAQDLRSLAGILLRLSALSAADRAGDAALPVGASAPPTGERCTRAAAGQGASSRQSDGFTGIARDL